MLLAFRVGGLAFRSSAAAVKRETVRWKNSPSAVGGVRLKSGEAAKSSPEKALSKSVLEEVILAEKPKPTTFGGKVAQKAENTILYGIVAVSLAALGAFAYVLGEQFFAADSPQKIYSRALARIREDGRCQDLFGEKIAGFGEDGGRGRRRHVAHHKYKKDGQERIRVLFHLKGERDEGTAQVEMACEDGTWQERFLFVETKSHPKITHILVDNRSWLDDALRETIGSGSDVDQVVIFGNGHFDATGEAGADQLFLALEAAERYGCKDEIYFQDPSCTSSEEAWLLQRNIHVLKSSAMRLPKAPEDAKRLILFIHNPHGLLEELLKESWPALQGETYQKNLFVCNDYRSYDDRDFASSPDGSLSYLAAYCSCATYIPPPSPDLLANPISFYQTVCMYAPAKKLPHTVTVLKNPSVLRNVLK